jgi:hypothetical protein
MRLDAGRQEIRPRHHFFNLEFSSIWVEGACSANSPNNMRSIIRPPSWWKYYFGLCVYGMWYSLGIDSRTVTWTLQQRLLGAFKPASRVHDDRVFIHMSSRYQYRCSRRSTGKPLPHSAEWYFREFRLSVLVI